MSNPPNMSALIAALLGGNVIEITPKAGQSMEDAIAEHEAKHREECPGCASAHKAEQAKADTTRQEELAKGKAAFEATQRGAGVKPESTKPTERVAAVVTQRIGESDQFVVQTPPGSALRVGTGLIVAPLAARTPIGFMLFAVKDGVMTPVRGSFESDRETIDKKLEAFKQQAPVQALSALASLVGHDLMGNHEIRPLFAD